MTNKIEKRLQELGIKLPQINAPAANYIPYLKVGNLVFIAGQTCKWNGALQYAGKVGKDYDIKDAKDAARLCGLNIILQVKNACDGDLSKVKKCAKLTVFINSADDFFDQASVANGVSDLMIEVFGDNGKHVRTSVSANSLPGDSAVEVDAIFEVEQ